MERLFAAIVDEKEAGVLGNNNDGEDDTNHGLVTHIVDIGNDKRVPIIMKSPD